jgi:TPP-dependent pyruvate/acetoin dehydrogenase alpha subunit
MDVLDTHTVLSEAIERVRTERRPLLVEAVTYRFRGHSMADPEQYRSKEEVAHWRERDPLVTFAARLQGEGVLTEVDVKRIDEEAIATVDEAVEFADASPFPSAESLYDDIYVLGEGSRGWYSVETTEDREQAPSLREQDSNQEIPQQLTSALAAGEDSGEQTTEEQR